MINVNISGLLSSSQFSFLHIIDRLFTVRSKSIADFIQFFSSRIFPFKASNIALFHSFWLIVNINYLSFVNDLP